MQTVNLYIDTSVKNPRRQDGTFIYILEAPECAGRNTRTYVGRLKDTTENQLTIYAMAAALKRLKEPCYLNIYTDCQYAEYIIESGLLKRWKENEWQGKNGKEICDVAKWREIEYLLNAQHFHIYVKKEHAYKNWLKNELKKV